MSTPADNNIPIAKIPTFMQLDVDIVGFFRSNRQLQCWKIIIGKGLCWLKLFPKILRDGTYLHVSGGKLGHADMLWSIIRNVNLIFRMLRLLERVEKVINY
jgi:hypothetical protein